MPDQCQRWIAEVGDRGSFAQELGIDRDTEVAAIRLARGALEGGDHDAVRRAGKHRAADDNDVVGGLVFQRLTDLLADAFQV